MSIKKGEQWVLSETGAKVIVTHVSALSIGWRMKGQRSTTHTSRSYFLETSYKVVPRANKQLNAKVKRVIAAIGSIGTFGKIIDAVQDRSKATIASDKVRSSLTNLVEIGEIYHFEHSDTYMILDKGSK